MKVLRDPIFFEVHTLTALWLVKRMTKSKTIWNGSKPHHGLLRNLWFAQPARTLRDKTCKTDPDAPLYSKKLCCGKKQVGRTMSGSLSKNLSVPEATNRRSSRFHQSLHHYLFLSSWERRRAQLVLRVISPVNAGKTTIKPGFCNPYYPRRSTSSIIRACRCPDNRRILDGRTQWSPCEPNRQARYNRLLFFANYEV